MKIETRISVGTTVDKPHVRTFTAFDSAKRPSWRVYGKGWGELSISSHSSRKYLEFHITESAESETKKGRHTARTTMFSLDEPDARKLYQWLKEHFE